MVDQDSFVKKWNGSIVLCKRLFKETESSEKFGFRWFFPEIVLQGKYYRDIAVISIVSNFIGYFTPFLLQIMIDKVVSHRSFHTLVSVLIIFSVLTIFDSLFGYIKQNLITFASCRIDARLCSKVFERMLGLPLTYFENNSAGVVQRNMGQTEGIRSFLTGQLFQIGLDILPMPVLLGMLGSYSMKLTMVVLGYSAIIGLTIALLLPIFKRQLEVFNEVEGTRLSHLVETLVGMRTVKSLVLGPSRWHTWDLKNAQSKRRMMNVGKFGAAAGCFTQFLAQAMQLSIMGVGAQAIFDGDLTIGSLIAFNMLSGRVTGPLIGLIGLLNSYQQVALSMGMLGSIMDHPPEREPGQRYIYPRIDGAMEFKEVTFHYPGASNPALDQVSFKVEPGQVIGIVGRSGSGKSTITRLMQGIYTPDSGLVTISGEGAITGSVDIRPAIAPPAGAGDPVVRGIIRVAMTHAIG